MGFWITAPFLLAAATAAATATRLSSLAAIDLSDDTPLPLVIWNGLDDTFDSEGIQALDEIVNVIHPGTFVYSISVTGTGRSPALFGNVSSQLAAVCDTLASHPVLSAAPAIDAVGFSQGGQFLRGYVERCNNPPIRSLVTFGSHHNGISKFKECASADYRCRSEMALLRSNLWSSFTQSFFVLAQYFRDPEDYQSYLDGSNFLADINNEREHKNNNYRRNLASLRKFVMFMFEDDTMVMPRESSWFGEVTAEAKIPLRERKMYLEDWLGLRELDENGGIVFRSINADHMQIPRRVFNDTIREFFGPYWRKFRSHRYQDPVMYGDFTSEEL
ncbi:hypothetical protein K4F52_009971 [Lecanicillium sp. MT-2017a]|nr:hypothetical protein K4F52_009971 [Lecanicillium sp. MT-2017a]